MAAVAHAVLSADFSVTFLGLHNDSVHANQFRMKPDDECMLYHSTTPHFAHTVHLYK